MSESHRPMTQVYMHRTLKYRVYSGLIGSKSRPQRPPPTAVATGGYIGIYTPPKSVYPKFFLCGCFVSLTQDKFDIVPVTSV